MDANRDDACESGEPVGGERPCGAQLPTGLRNRDTRRRHCFQLGAAKLAGEAVVLEPEQRAVHVVSRQEGRRLEQDQLFFETDREGGLVRERAAAVTGDGRGATAPGGGSGPPDLHRLVGCPGKHRRAAHCGATPLAPAVR